MASPCLRRRELSGLPLSPELPIAQLTALRRLGIINTGEEEVLRLRTLAGLPHLEELWARQYFHYDLSGLPPSVKRLHLQVGGRAGGHVWADCPCCLLGCCQAQLEPSFLGCCSQAWPRLSCRACRPHTRPRRFCAVARRRRAGAGAAGGAAGPAAPGGHGSDAATQRPAAVRSGACTTQHEQRSVHGMRCRAQCGQRSSASLPGEGGRREDC